MYTSPSPISERPDAYVRPFTAIRYNLMLILPASCKIALQKAFQIQKVTAKTINLIVT